VAQHGRGDLVLSRENVVDFRCGGVTKRRAANRCATVFGLNFNSAIFNRWIPPPRYLHPYPGARFYSTHPS
jgi:hypothetical protein